MGYEPPEEPVIFLKAISSLCGATDPIVKPKNSTKLDYEVEMAAIIGRTTINVTEAEALDYVAGYALMNDASERAFQRERPGGTTKGKSADTLGPLGPWLVTSDEVRDPQNMNLWTRVNGEARQAGNTNDMVFGFAQLIAYVTEFMSLQPGDVVEMGIDGLGEQRHEIVEFPG